MTTKQGGLRGSIRNVGVGVSDIPDSVVSRPDDTGDFGNSDKQGVQIETKTQWPSIGARISNLTQDATRAYLYENDGTLINDVDISSLSSNDAFTFSDVDLAANTKYLIVLDAEGASYRVGFENASDYPYTSDDVDMTATVLSGLTIDDTEEVRAVNDVGNVGFD